MTARGRLRSLLVSAGFKSFVLDQLDGLGDVVARSMFGGVGLYCEGLFFGIIASDVLYLKADDTNRPLYERAGALPFTPYAGRAAAMSYYSVPAGVLESEPEVIEWARKAVDAAARAAAAPRPRGRSGQRTKMRRARPGRPGRRKKSPR